MRVYSIQMSKRFVTDALGYELIDSTVKSGLGLLAPSWELVLGHKNGTISNEEYTERYYELMRQRYRENREWFLDLCRKPYICVVACYCKAGDFCHRILLMDILRKICEKNNIEFEYLGELS